LELVDFRITKSELGAFSEMKTWKLYGMWRPSVAQFLKCFSHSFTRNKRKSKKAPLTS
jgi:hypothetical protein